MRRAPWWLVFLLLACDPARVYESNFDFHERYWPREVHPAFEFTVPKDGKYNLYMNLRNEASFEFSNIYFRFQLTDSTGRILDEQQKTEFLFDEKSGKPFGSTTLGDIYDHQFLLLGSYPLVAGGRYTARLEQFMRIDTLSYVLSAGLRVEHAGDAPASR